MNNSQHFQEMFRRKVVNYSAVNHGRVQPATPFTAPAFLDTLQISMKTDKAFYPIDTKSVSMSLNNNNSKVLFLGEDYMVARKEDNQCIIRKTKCFDFWERNVLFPKTKRSFFRTPTLPFSA